MSYLPQNPLTGEVRADVISLLGKSAGWLRFLSVLSLLFGAFSLVAALAFAHQIRALAPALSTFGAAVSVLFIGFAVIYLVCGIRMWAYASSIRRMQAGRALRDFESAMERQASLWITVAAMVGATILIGVGLAFFLVVSLGAAAAPPA